MKGTKLVLRQMIGVVTTVADELKEHFVQYYDQIMSVMKRVMVDMLNEEDQVLIGKTVECVTAIGLAVGKDKVRSNRNLKEFLRSTITLLYGQMLEVMQFYSQIKLCT